MKAEEILTKVANEHSYEDWGECMYDTHPHSQIEYAIQAMREYARIQIEKDRERIINSIIGDESGSDIIKIIENTTIILD